MTETTIAAFAATSVEEAAASGVFGNYHEDQFDSEFAAYLDEVMADVPDPEPADLLGTVTPMDDRMRDAWEAEMDRREAAAETALREATADGPRAYTTVR